MSSSVHKVKTRPKKSDLKRILQDKKKRVRFYLLASGILFVLVGLYFSPKANNFNNPNEEISTPNTDPNSTLNDNFDSFSQEPIKVDKNLMKENKNISKNPPVKILIPELNIDLPIKEAKIIKGYWEVFPDTAGWGMGSAYPQDSGNQVIFAHAKKGLFLSLREAKTGQKVYIVTKDKWYEYIISSIREVLPTQTELVAPTSDPILTLYTCSGFTDSKRFIVVAKRM